VLWRPLEVKFERRAPLIGACMRLHNFCIDKRIGEEEINKFNMNGGGAVPVPGEAGKTKDRWHRTPVYKDGKPVKYLLDPTLPPAAAAAAGGAVGRGATRERLFRAVEESGVVRPAPSGKHK